MQEKNDQEILSLIKDGDAEKGFRLLVETYQEKLYWQIRRMVTFHADADDVLQNTFLKVYKSILGFKGDSKLSTWLYRIATNESITFLNKRKKKRTENLEDDSNNIENTLRASTYFDEENALIALQEAISSLPEKQKAVFTLRYYEEIKYAEMAEILGGSIGSLKASYHHAVKKIEEYLKGKVEYV